FCHFAKRNSGSDPNFPSKTEYNPVGCDKCGHTGYQGRVGIYELLLTTDQIRAQIHNRASEADIRATALKNGMHSMREDGERWLADGTTTQAELLRVTKAKD
ncbi:MAG: hypothetical protein Q8J90_00025, partial [Gallionella sp.]|nr:hypothetical protein [Gallionella sp.]